MVDLQSAKVLPAILLTVLLVGAPLVYTPTIADQPQPTAEVLLEGLSHPTGLAVDREGNVYFSEFAVGGFLKKYGVDGRIATLMSNLTSATGVAVGAEGEVYVVGAADGILWRLAPGSLEPEPILERRGMWDLAVDGEGNLYITIRSVNGSLLKLPRGSDGTETLLSGLSVPYGVTVDGAGAVYFVEFGNLTASNGTLKMLPKGQSEPVALLEGLSNPYDVAVDSAGRIYFTEKAGTLKVLVPGGGEPQLLLSDLGRIYGLALDGRGGLLMLAFGSPIGEGGDGALLSLQVSEAPGLWWGWVWVALAVAALAVASSVFLLTRRGRGGKVKR